MGVFVAIAVPISVSTFLVHSLNVYLQRYETVELAALATQPEMSRVRVDDAVVDASRTGYHDHSIPGRPSHEATVAALRAPGSDPGEPVAALLRCNGRGEDCAGVWRRRPITGEVWLDNQELEEVVDLREQGVLLAPRPVVVTAVRDPLLESVAGLAINSTFVLVLLLLTVGLSVLVERTPAPAKTG